jgi:hypothetical protein
MAGLEEKLSTERNLEKIQRLRARLERFRDIEKKLLAHIASTNEVDDA